MAYFERTGTTSLRPTHHVGGAWNTDEQHIAPALGLLAHAVERDLAQRRTDPLVPARLCYDIWGTVPMEAVETSVEVLRPGRTVELVEARLTHAGRTAATLRAWLLRPGDTAALEATAVPGIDGPGATPGWDPTTLWPGGFIDSVEVRRAQQEPGRARVWVRTSLPLVDGEPVSPLARAAGLLDIANGMTVRVAPDQVAFPNVDLTAHLFRTPSGEWLGFDTTVSFGPDGTGLTSSVLHDADGPFGTMSQALTLRRRRAPGSGPVGPGQESPPALPVVPAVTSRSR